MRFVKQGKTAWKIWHERRLLTEAEERVQANWSRLALAISSSLFAVLTLVVHGLLIAIPFGIIAIFLYVRKA